MRASLARGALRRRPPSTELVDEEGEERGVSDAGLAGLLAWLAWLARRRERRLTVKLVRSLG